MNNKNNKKGKEFFELLRDLDEDIVEDAWEEKSGRITIVEVRTPLGVFRDIAAAAACAAVIAIGIFGFIKIKNLDVTPNESGTSYNESSLTGSDITSSILKIQPDSDNAIAFSDINTAEKLDNENYAVVYIKDTNANENMPMYITVYSFYDNWIKNRPVSDTVKVTGPGEYTVHYTELRGAGSINSLNIEAGKEWENFEFTPALKGTWIP